VGKKIHTKIYTPIIRLFAYTMRYRETHWRTWRTIKWTRRSPHTARGFACVQFNYGRHLSAVNVAGCATSTWKLST